MGLRRNPSQRQRRLGAELRRLRKESGTTATRAGAEFGFSPAHLNNIEAGRTAIQVAKLRGLADFYGCKNEQLVDVLVSMSQSNGRGWWSEYRYPPHNDAARDLAELESMSVRHRAVQWLHVPGMLQTAEYMRELFESGEHHASPDTLDRFVDFRLRRQRPLVEARPPEFHAVIHEAALRMAFVKQEVMRRQIEHLIEMARLPHVQIQVLPFRADAYQVRFSCSFDCYDALAPELSTVYLEHPTQSPFVVDQANLREFSDSFEKLSDIALPPVCPEAGGVSPRQQDSRSVLQRVLQDL